MKTGITKILFPTDFSDVAASALAAAGDIAKKFGAEVHLVSVVDPQIYAYAGYVSMLSNEEMLEGPRKRMEALELPANFEGLTVHREVIEGYVDEAVADYAKHNSVDLVVMSSHSRSKVARFFLGSVADRVMRSAPCPVLLLRGPDPAEQSPSFALDAVSTIVAPCDFSTASEEAYRRACMLAQPYGATVHLVHALDLGALSLLGVDFDEIALNTATERAKEHLQRVASTVEGANVVQSVIEGDPSEVVIEYAKKVNADLCVMGNTRRSEMGKLFLGSVTDTVARSTHLPVWIEPVERSE